MPDRRARLKNLIQEKCVLEGDFLLASGLRSKVFFDCKRVTLDPEGLHLIATLILDLIDDLARKDGRPIDAIGGPTIGADPIVGHVAGLSWQRAHAAAEGGASRGAPGAASPPGSGAPGGVSGGAPPPGPGASSEPDAHAGGPPPSDSSAPPSRPETPARGGARPLRGFLVRKETKDHGTQRVIENDVPRGARVVIFEDVVTTGASTLQVVRKAIEAGLEVAAVVALVDRDQGGAEALSRYRYVPFFKKSDFGI